MYHNCIAIGAAESSPMPTAPCCNPQILPAPPVRVGDEERPARLALASGAGRTRNNGEQAKGNTERDHTAILLPCLARRDIDDELGELGRVAGALETFDHFSPIILDLGTVPAVLFLAAGKWGTA
jgi:hypothetical protein